VGLDPAEDDVLDDKADQDDGDEAGKDLVDAQLVATTES